MFTARIGDKGDPDEVTLVWRSSVSGDLEGATPDPIDGIINFTLAAPA